jgi:hypothetical protein
MYSCANLVMMDALTHIEGEWVTVLLKACGSPNTATRGSTSFERSTKA